MEAPQELDGRAGCSDRTGGGADDLNTRHVRGRIKITDSYGIRERWQRREQRGRQQQ